MSKFTARVNGAVRLIRIVGANDDRVVYHASERNKDRDAFSAAFCCMSTPGFAKRFPEDKRQYIA